MPTIKNLTEDTAAVVGLPEDAIHISVWEGSYNLRGVLKGRMYLGYIFERKGNTIKLPPGSWSIVGWSDELTYEQKGFICKRENGYFEDYCGDGYLFTSVTLSFASLLCSHGITDRALIIKKEK